MTGYLIDLKSCHQCGKTPRKRREGENHWTIHCCISEAGGFTLEEAAEIWNRRAPNEITQAVADAFADERKRHAQYKVQGLSYAEQRLGYTQGEIDEINAQKGIRNE